ncbi:TPA: tetratricopeptide repeat protein [Candidatus Poribacteria bacterium]|nr:tetratricopeptide repeat protein [Candidatus Poribacteria bacterium]
MAFSNYYEILNVKRDATVVEIKSAFRSLAKRCHPDKNPGNERQAEKQFRYICKAYETLIDEKKRIIHDYNLRQYERQNKSRNVYKENLIKRAQKNNTRSMCQLILEELMNNNLRQAVQIYERLKTRIINFEFTLYMNYADSRDCEFLLAEAYQTLGGYEQAAQLYERVIENEKHHSHFRHFIKEVKMRLKKVYYYGLAKPANAEESIIHLQKILELGLSKRDTAWVYKKLAESYCESENFQMARENLEKAFKICPNLTGAKKICKKLGVEYFQKGN